MLNQRKPETVLPTTKHLIAIPTTTHGGVPFPKRYARFGFLALLSFSSYIFLSSFGSKRETSIDEPPTPPLYEKYHAWERNLPQHNPTLPFPEGKDTKFFWISNHAQNAGWGNAMQEHVLNALLAYETGRAFVFDNFTWDRDGPDYSNYNGKNIPSRIPMSAMLSGPIMGDPFPPGDPTPRAVSKDYFHQVCGGGPYGELGMYGERNHSRVILRTEDIVTEHERFTDSVSAGVLFGKWVEKLNSVQDRCVEVAEESSQLFEIWIFGSKRILDLWPALSRSPLITHFGWSPLIHQAIATNMNLFRPRSLIPSLSFSPPSFLYPLVPASLRKAQPTDRTATFPGLLVLHVRKGDFEEHCYHLANWSSTFNGFNTFPELPDPFVPPSGAGKGQSTPGARAVYLRHCMPSVEEILRKVRVVRRDERKRLQLARERRDVIAEGEGELRRVYIMTNAPAPWVEELKVAVSEMEWPEDGEGGRFQRWEGVASSRELNLDWEQRYVAQTVDMVVGQRAQVFVGNGFSSLTSNIVMLRMAKGVPPETNRFW